MFIDALLVFLLFSLVASGVYVMNDLIDVDQDKLHEKKRFRPIASGAISKQVGMVLSFVLIFSGLVGTLKIFGGVMFLLILSYFVLNIFYSISLKKVPPLDIIIIAIFYLLRPVVGALAIHVEITNWLVLTTFFAALYLVVLKRKAELVRVKKTEIVTRKNIEQYDEPTLDKIAMMILSVCIVSYAIYSSNFNGFFVLTTIPLVGLGLRAILVSRLPSTDFENPERFIYKDPISLAFFLIWLCSVIVYHV